MIVRDEIDCLEACLDSLAPWVDEIAILDTGSVDGTWELVKLRAHSSSQIEWPDHFAEARNQSLDLAQGDWVLVVDADERIVSGGQELRAAIEDPNLVAAEITIVNEMGDGSQGEFGAVRLFRRLPELRYTGRIHEQIAGAVRAVMSADSRWKTGRVPLVLHHDGYLPEKFQAKGKAERNVRLLETAMAELSADAAVSERVYLEYKLATALGPGPTGQMWLLRAARRLLDAGPGELSTVPLGAEILVSAAQAWSRSGEGNAALEAATSAALAAPGHPMVALVRAQAHMALGELDEAAASFLAAEAPGSGGFYFDKEAHAAAVAIGRSELKHRQGQSPAAVAILQEACALHPENRQLELARLHGLVRGGQAEQALREGIAYLKAYPQDRNGLLLCAAAAEALGMKERAQRWRGMAMS